MIKMDGQIKQGIRLHRCPFCGSKATIEHRGIWYVVKCGGACIVTPPTRDCAECDVQPRTPGSLSLSDAVHMWNKRSENTKGYSFNNNLEQKLSKKSEIVSVFNSIESITETLERILKKWELLDPEPKDDNKKIIRQKCFQLVNTFRTKIKKLNN